jgi:hypothetical protein
VSIQAGTKEKKVKGLSYPKRLPAFKRPRGGGQTAETCKQDDGEFHFDEVGEI